MRSDISQQPVAAASNGLAPASLRPSESMPLVYMFPWIQTKFNIAYAYILILSCHNFFLLYFILEPSLLGAPFRRDISFSESDPDVKRRLLTMNHSQDLRYRGSGDPPLLSRLPGQLPVPAIQPQGGRLSEEDINRGRFNNQPSGIVQGSDLFRPDRQRARQNSLGPSTLSSVTLGFPSHVMEVKSEEVCLL